jgi:hypothetical protein
MIAINLKEALRQEYPSTEPSVAFLYRDQRVVIPAAEVQETVFAIVGSTFAAYGGKRGKVADPFTPPLKTLKVL